jgi:hypothetical protein
MKFQSHRCSTRFAFVVLLAAAPLSLTACDKKASGTSGAGASAAAPDANASQPEAGVLKGTARDAQGKPLKSFGGSISGYSLKSGQSQTVTFEGKDGVFHVNTGPGQFSSRAWTDVEYNGRNYRIDLRPVDGKSVLATQDTTNGVVKDFVWQLGGFRPGFDERTDDRFYSHHGGSVMLYAEGNGAAYQEAVLRNYSAKAEPKIPVDSTVEVTLTPDGPMIDGSAGKPVVLKSKPADVRGYMNRLTRGIPIGKYKATARELTASGETKPLRVVQSDTFGKTTPVGPAESITVEFIQSKPPSDNINCVDEINLLVMY